MLDLSHIPNSEQDIKIFYANPGPTIYQTWQKPRKCSFIYIISIDAGGGGCGGVSTILNNTTITSYAIGGGSGAVTRALINSNLVPDTLYIRVGKGGVGGASTSASNNSANSGSTGEASGVYISSQLTSLNNNAQAVSFLGGAIANNGGSLGVLSPGTPASVLTNNYLIGLTNFISLVGKTSFDSLSGEPPLTSNILTSGGSGAPYPGLATGGSGTSILSSSISPFIAGGIGGTTVGGNGADGYTSWKPFFSTGGAGGGNATTGGGVAGNGGKGGIGSGGAGGGFANAGTSGRGGDGGDGIVIVVAF
jgi:hypothetical protein